jgi:geranylgeranyl diphosphate synthase type I
MSGSAASAFAAYAGRVREIVDVRLAAALAEHVERAQTHGPAAHAVALALTDLTMRGGKRLRAVLLAAAYEACGGQGGPEAVALAGVAIELLQTYLLIHDDWMDGDATRRGGPAMHVALRSTFGAAGGRTEGTPPDADAAAILAGDQAAALAQQALFAVPLAPARVLEAARIFASIQEEVVVGQILDVHGGHAARAQAVEHVHELKTASYTVRGPFAMGAALAGADFSVQESLARVARPLGVAFQLKDDLLGAFGDARATGKPVGSDLRQGKRTSVVVEALADAEGRAHLLPVLGVADAPAAAVDAALAWLSTSPARARVEARIDALLAETHAELARAAIGAGLRGVLEGAVRALAEREN